MKPTVTMAVAVAVFALTPVIFVACGKSPEEKQVEEIQKNAEQLQKGAESAAKSARRYPPPASASAVGGDGRISSRSIRSASGI